MDPRDTLKKSIDEHHFNLWFLDAVFHEKGLTVTSKFKANAIQERFTSQLYLAFGGDYEITVKPKKKASEPAPPLQLMLPFWPEVVRGAPNSFLRSALFPAIQAKDRQYLKDSLLGSQNTYTVRFTGQQLDQSDLDVWEQAVHLVRGTPLGNSCVVTGNAFLKSMGRSAGKNDYNWLDQSIDRLIACAVKIKRTKPDTKGREMEFTGSLLSSCIKVHEKHKKRTYGFILDPALLRLYTASDWTAVQWEERKALRRSSLALWLHGYYSSHATPLPVKVDTLRQLSGSRTQNLKHFRAALKRAFTALEKVAGIIGTIDKETDLVTVIRKPTPAQLEYLKKHGLPPIRDTSDQNAG